LIARSTCRRPTLETVVLVVVLKTDGVVVPKTDGELTVGIDGASGGDGR